MSKGYPDFFGMSIFTQYGSFKRKDEDTIFVAAGDTVKVLTISAKGKIYFGTIRLHNVADPTDVDVIITIDGSAFTLDSLYTTHYYNNLGIWGSAASLMLYNPGSLIYALGLRGDITFVDSYAISIVNTTGAGLTAYCAVGWSEII